jgi:anaphase-promoting complex subunit 5
MHNRDRTFYQYALLNLAILQADFGCYSEALAAMRETIATARENKDLGCLNFSLSWLYHFGKVHPGETNRDTKGGMMGVEREGLAFLKAKAKENGMWSLMATSLLSEARMIMANVSNRSFLLLERRGRSLFVNVNLSRPNARAKIRQEPSRISCRALT